jgi:feruloyl esterase
MVAPWYVGAGHQDLRGATHSVPGFEDAKHDVVLAMMDWVERGVAPGEIVATKFRGDDATGGGVVERQRPLCAYPGQARLVGEDADVDAAESWKCE